jgi:hypothetical protein
MARLADINFVSSKPGLSPKLIFGKLPYPLQASMRGRMSLRHAKSRPTGSLNGTSCPVPGTGPVRYLLEPDAGKMPAPHLDSGVDGGFLKKIMLKQ